MDAEHEFTIGGSRYRGSHRIVEELLAQEEPETIQKYAVEVGGRSFPVKQAVASGLGAPRASFQTQEAFRVLRRLGFEPTEVSKGG